MPSTSGLGDTGGHEPPLLTAERVLVAAFAEVLGLESVGRRDNFIELGGDSLRAMSVSAFARRRGLAVTAHQVLRSETLAALAELAEAVPPLQASPAAPAAGDPSLRTWDDETISQLLNGTR
ncbi:phosphopantetheine-binding protein [Streptomyces sp. NPDC048290]|uniref:phosphopantetheine-binding protein n=1 Tax=Streptomyces sp. NPDC048290 TaxID=3155811 RepID=UPI003432C3CC